MPVDAAKGLDHERLDEEGQGWVREGKIPVRHPSYGDAPGCIQDIAEVPQDTEPQALPERQGGGGSE